MFFVGKNKKMYADDVLSSAQKRFLLKKREHYRKKLQLKKTISGIGPEAIFEKCDPY